MTVLAPTARRLDRSTLALHVASMIAAVGILLATAGPTVACSCAMPGPMKDYATLEHAVFTGTAGVQAARGVPVDVDQWLWGMGAADVVWLSASSFGDSAGCGVNPPAQGSKWIWVAWLPGNSGDFGTGLCSPAGDLSTPEGQAMLTDATSAFAAIDPPRSPPSSSPEPPAVAATPQPEEQPAASSAEASLLLVGGALALVTVGLFGGLALVARRQDRSSRRA